MRNLRRTYKLGFFVSQLKNFFILIKLTILQISINSKFEQQFRYIELSRQILLIKKAFPEEIEPYCFTVFNTSTLNTTLELKMHAKGLNSHTNLKTITKFNI